MKRMIAILMALLAVTPLITACSDNNMDLTIETLPEDTITRIDAPVDSDTFEETTAEIIQEETTVVETTIVATAPEIIETEAPIIESTPPNNSNPYYIVTADEREMIARLVTQEAGICSLECKMGVASVIFNRLDDGRWGSTLHDVVYYPAAFSPAYLIPTTVACEDAYIAVDYVIANGPTLPTQVRYFRADYDFNWKGYKNYTTIDNTYFGYLEGWENGAW